ncbi:cache domain-containing protein [Niveibacterium umoris]|uniref:Cytochrome c n=1 Tax=Niveibacterium umoris TaxID=1193620 RepID=A0A840BWJ0_9RHOO|nr:cache domain-containing protein [Niveibacterium umoris]MBB4014677.1 cytochrome c [Niveibacterium umoris]
MHTLRRLFCAALLTLAAGAAFAQEQGSREEARALVEKALAHIKSAGMETAFTEFSTPGSKPWHDRDLYLFAYDFSGKNVAHGANPKLRNTSLIDLKTADGKFLIREMIEMAKTKGEGWIDYTWPHPQTKELEKKSAYVKRIPGYDGFVGCGVYFKK